jgi:hypothetical protein
MSETVTIESLAEQFAAIKSAMEQNGQALIGQFFKDAMPADVEAIRWTQYTPHFNDGEPCTFRCNNEDVDVKFLPKAKDDAASADDDSDDDGFTSYYGDDNPALSSFLEKVCAVPDEMYEAAFGDGVRVTVTRDPESGAVTIEVDDYDHD